MGRALPFCAYHPLDGDSICGTSLVVHKGLFPSSEESIQFENEKIELAISDSSLKQDSPSGIILPENSVQIGYSMRNPTKEKLATELAFPVMHGFYGFNNLSITVDDKEVPYTLSDHEKLMKLICEQAEDTLNKKNSSYGELHKIVKALMAAQSQQECLAFKISLVDYSQKELRFNHKNAVLLGEYYYLKSLYLMSENEKSFYEYLREKMDIYKCGDLHTRILKLFESATPLDYKAIFGLWAGPERPVSLDADTGQLRDRENGYPAPYLYHRRNYLTKNFEDKIQEESFELIAKALFVTINPFPMGLVKYRVNFNPLESHRVKISYKQIMAIDIKGKKVSGQFQYILKSAKGRRPSTKGTLSIKVPKNNAAAIFPSLQAKVENRGNDKVYSAAFDNYDSNLYIAVSEL